MFKLYIIFYPSKNRKKNDCQIERENIEVTIIHYVIPIYGKDLTQSKPNLRNINVNFSFNVFNNHV